MAAVSTSCRRAGSQKEAEPFASNVLAIDAQDNLYSAGSARVFRILPGGSFQTIAGSGRSAFVDGVGKAASFNNPRQMAVDASGILYVVDYSGREGYRLRRVTQDGTVTTVNDAAGKAIGSSGSIDGLAVDPHGNIVYSSVKESCIRSLAPDGAVTVLAGSKGRCGGPHDTRSFREGPVSEVMLWYPSSLAVAPNGDIYCNDQFLRRVLKISGGRVSVAAGNSPIDQTGAFGNVQGGTQPGYRDGKAREALFTENRALAIDPSGNIWIVDQIQAPGGTLRKLSPDGMVTTLSK